MSVDINTAYDSYVKRFELRFGARDVGAFVRFGRTMVQHLAREEFEARLKKYLRWHSECTRLIGSGGTISDVLVLEFEEASAWVCLEAPNVLSMFAGEVGEPIGALGAARIPSTPPQE